MAGGKNYQKLFHEFEPFYRPDSRVLVLGSFPSPKSREQGFYYGHPQNRFWRVLAAVWHEPVPDSITEKKTFLIAHRIALWDVLASCEIVSASDQSIRNPESNDIRKILTAAPVEAVFTTGQTAFRLYERLCRPLCGMAARQLPSPSPANCAVSFETLRQAYEELRSERN